MLFYPAAMDPNFSDGGLDDGYLTTVPGIRAATFYSDPDFDPAVVALDEKRKDVVPGPELMTGFPVVLSTATQALALNNDLQVRDSAAWSSRFVGQRQLARKHDFDDGSRFDDIMNGLPDCGGLTVTLQ